MGKIEVRGNAERTVDYDLMKIKIDFHAKEETPDKASKKVMRECEEFLAKLKEIAEKAAKKKEEEVVEEAPKGPTTEELLAEILAEIKKDKE